jgi:predicted nucleic acid-binding protein
VILVDTSVWVDHLRASDRHLTELLESGIVLAHPWVFGEIVLGGLREGSEVTRLMPRPAQATVATSGEILRLINNNGLARTGIGYVDSQLLASARLTPDALMWTRDRRLDRVADRLGLAYQVPPRVSAPRPARRTTEPPGPKT